MAHENRNGEKVSEFAAATNSWHDALPRESWSAFERVDSSAYDDWFTVYRLPGDVYAIEESSQWEDDICYLAPGRDRAVLIDTSLGISSVGNVVRHLTDLPVTVLITHMHHDHIGCAHEFDDVRCFDSEVAVQALRTGTDDYGGHLEYEFVPEAIPCGLPEGFDPKTFKIRGVEPSATFADGDVLDIGGRVLQVLHTPGHTSDSCCFVDRAHGMIFTGDTYYPAPLYTFTRDSNIGEYAASMHRVGAMTEGIKYLCCGHNEVSANSAILESVGCDMDEIIAGGAKDYELRADSLLYYHFADGAIVTTKS